MAQYNESFVQFGMQGDEKARNAQLEETIKLMKQEIDELRREKSQPKRASLLDEDLSETPTRPIQPKPFQSERKESGNLFGDLMSDFMGTGARPRYESTPASLDSGINTKSETGKDKNVQFQSFVDWNFEVDQTKEEMRCDLITLKEMMGQQQRSHEELSQAMKDMQWGRETDRDAQQRSQEMLVKSQEMLAETMNQGRQNQEHSLAELREMIKEMRQNSREVCKEMTKDMMQLKEEFQIKSASKEEGSKKDYRLPKSEEDLEPLSAQMGIAGKICENKAEKRGSTHEDTAKMESNSEGLLPVESEITALRKRLEELQQKVEQQHKDPKVFQQVKTTTGVSTEEKKVDQVPASTQNEDHNDNSTRLSSAGSKQKVKVATYDGKGPWQDYKTHFDMCAVTNKWNEVDKGLHLATSLRGQAQAVLSNMRASDRQDYKVLIKTLEDRFAPASQTELYRAQLREREQRPGESLPEMAQDIFRLVNQIYPTAQPEMLSAIAVEKFVEKLRNRDVRIRVTQAKPSDLNRAVSLAVELESIYKGEGRRQDSGGKFRTMKMNDTESVNKSINRNPDFINMQKELNLLSRQADSNSKFQKEIAQLRHEIKTILDRLKYKEDTKPKQLVDEKQPTSGERLQSPRSFPQIECFRCGKQGHIARDCQNPRSMITCFNCGKKGHIAKVCGRRPS